MGNKNSGLSDIFEVISNAYLRATPETPIYDLDIPKRYIDVLERWIFIDKQRSIGYPKMKTKDIMVKYQRKYNLSTANFYIDKRHCEQLFGESAVINKEYEKKIAVQNYDELYSLALSKGDVKSAIEAIKGKCLLLGLFDKDLEQDIRHIGDRNFVMNTTIVLDGKLIEERQIDISNLQNMPIKELRALGQMVDKPEATFSEMEKMIDESNDVGE